MAYLFAVLILQREAAQHESYQISRAQLEALQEFRRGRVSTKYSWDLLETTPWLQGTPLPAEALNGRLPLLGIEGHAFWTTDRTLKAAQQFPDLAYINLSYCCRISDAGISELTKLKSLEVLVLYRNHARFGGSLVSPMISSKQAEKMQQPIKDESLEHIAEIGSLKVLYLADNKFSEDALMRLQKLKALKYLAIDSTQLSETNRNKLQRSLPACKIVVWQRRTE